MRWAYQIKYKLRAALVLTGIIVVILLSNFSETRSISSLDNSMSSIYHDRLMPATYLYEISSNLYQKRLLHDEGTRHTPAELSALAQKHNEAIAGLVASYETTYLTREEQKQWAAFKAHLHEYDALESTWLQQHAANNAAAAAMHGKVEARFNATIQNLNTLTKIQAGEGDNLQKSSHSLINTTRLLSYLEMSLLIVLGLATLVLLSTTDSALFRKPQNQAMN